MADSQITIFYSWQSDLPGSDTRNIIQDSIKAAVCLLRDTVDIEADRDTKGEFGSPDIAQTIFSKRRLTPFSLKGGKSKGEIKRYIKSVIQDSFIP